MAKIARTNWKEAGVDVGSPIWGLLHNLVKLIGHWTGVVEGEKKTGGGAGEIFRMYYTQQSFGGIRMVFITFTHPLYMHI